MRLRAALRRWADVDRFTAALDAGGGEPGRPDWAPLLELAAELQDSLAAPPLTPPSRRRIFRRALALAGGEAASPARRGRHPRRRATALLARAVPGGRMSALLGGAIVVAAIGLGVAHQRRAHGTA